MRGFAPVVVVGSLALAASASADELSEFQAEFDAALARTVAETGSCRPGRDAVDDETVQFVWTLGPYLGDGDHWDFTVRVTGEAPTTLLLLSTHSTLWRLAQEEGAQVRNVVVSGDGPSLVTGLPPGAHVFSFDEREPPQEACTPGDLSTDGPWWSLQWANLWMGNLFEEFADYMGRPIDSVVEVLPESTEASLGPQAIAHTAEVRWTGAMMLRYLDYPVPELAERDPEAPAVLVPAGLSQQQLGDWLLTEGLAISAPDSLLDYLCLREVAERKVRGLDTEMERLRDPMDVGTGLCRVRNFWGDLRHLILLASIDLGGDYPCPQGGKLKLHLPEGVGVRGRFYNCFVRSEPLRVLALVEDQGG